MEFLISILFFWFEMDEDKIAMFGIKSGAANAIIYQDGIICALVNDSELSIRSVKIYLSRLDNDGREFYHFFIAR